MPDSKADQEVYPQHGRQKEGVGFPIARLVAIMSLSIEVVLNYAIGPFQGKGSGEHSLFRGISDWINPEDVVLGDVYFPSYFFICSLQKQGADGVFRAQGQRIYDFRKGKVLGAKDHIVAWKSLLNQPG